MSMEERCAQFQTDAAKPRDRVKTPKEIDKLRKFLFKNQEYRFTDREQTHLFGAIQAHYAAHADLTEEEREPALMLVDDALKMPFTVFTTSHKKTYLKWHAKLTGEGDKAQQGAAGAGGDGSKPIIYTVYDLPEGGAVLGLMTDEGDTLELQLQPGQGGGGGVSGAGGEGGGAGGGACEPALLEQIRAAFEAGEDEVRVTLNADRTRVIGMVGGSGSNS